MVKVGFICEGACETILVNSEMFQKQLNDLQIECVFPIIDAEGKDNLLPLNIASHREKLEAFKPNYVVILTDLDLDKCFTLTRDRICPLENELVVISVKQLESWYLADSLLMSNLCKNKFHYEFPENETSPIETINKIVLDKTGRGIGKNAKIKFTNKVIKMGFTIQNAANHPNCQSAQYFIKKLESISKK